MCHGLNNNIGQFEFEFDLSHRQRRRTSSVQDKPVRYKVANMRSILIVTLTTLLALQCLEKVTSTTTVVGWL